MDIISEIIVGVLEPVTAPPDNSNSTRTAAIIPTTRLTTPMDFPSIFPRPYSPMPVKIKVKNKSKARRTVKPCKPLNMDVLKEGQMDGFF